MKKPSFLERLTGSVNMDEVDEVLDDENQMFDEDGAIAEDYADEESEWHGQDRLELPVHALSLIHI